MLEIFKVIVQEMLERQLQQYEFELSALGQTLKEMAEMGGLSFQEHLAKKVQEDLRLQVLEEMKINSEEGHHSIGTAIEIKLF